MVDDPDGNQLYFNYPNEPANDAAIQGAAGQVYPPESIR
jgi:hypothetical protein